MNTVKVVVEFSVDDAVDSVEFFRKFEAVVSKFSVDELTDVLSVVPKDGVFFCTSCGELKDKSRFFLRVRKISGIIDRTNTKCRSCQNADIREKRRMACLQLAK